MKALFLEKQLESCASTSASVLMGAKYHRGETFTEKSNKA